MLHTKNAHGRRPVTRRAFLMSVAICAGTLTTLFLNIATTGGAPINTLSRGQAITFG